MQKKLLVLAMLIALALTACKKQPLPGSMDRLCQSLNGTWSGTYSDPSGLFNSKPQPVSVSLLVDGADVVGQVTTPGASGSSTSAVTGPLWGQCHQGKITQVFLGSTEQCGHFIPKDQLDHGVGHFAPAGYIKNSKLTLYLPYENAMTQTDFVVQAKKMTSTVAMELKKRPKKLNHFCRQNLLEVMKQQSS